MTAVAICRDCDYTELAKDKTRASECWELHAKDTKCSLASFRDITNEVMA